MDMLCLVLVSIAAWRGFPLQLGVCLFLCVSDVYVAPPFLSFGVPSAPLSCAMNHLLKVFPPVLELEANY